MSDEQLFNVDIENNNNRSADDEDDNDGNNNNRNNNHPYIFLCGKSMNITRPQLAAVSLLAIDYLLSASYYSLLAPFLPSESLKKDLNQTQVGIIFGVFELVLIILIPVFGKYLQVFGIRFLFVSGLFLTSGSEILFGFLDACPNGLIFFIMCLACRIVSAIGVSMGLSYAIIGHYFPNRISSVVAFLEVFNGLGTMIGPVIGGFLFQIGGFRLPFFIMGGLLFLVFLFSLCFFPSPETDNPDEETSLPLLPLLKTPRIIFTLSQLFVASLSIGFIQPSIEIHLKPLGLTPLQLGLILLCPALLYMAITPVIGHICDKHKSTMPWFMALGTFGSGFAFSFVGPLSILKLPLNFWIFLSSFIVYGVCLAGLTIPVYAELVKVATQNVGYPNDLRMQGLISALFGSTWSLGALLGPQVGGYVVDIIGFDKALMVIVGSFFVSGFVYLLYFFTKTVCPKRQSRLVVRQLSADDDDYPDESNPLLS